MLRALRMGNVDGQCFSATLDFASWETSNKQARLFMTKDRLCTGRDYKSASNVDL